jgi:single-strand DNA-binding protein
MQKNRIELAGYLGAKPELRYLPSGTKVANVRLGETYHFIGRDGNSQSHTNWHNLVFYNDVADVAMTYEQGEHIHVEGSLQQRKFTPADGITRTVHEVHVKACHIISGARVDWETTPLQNTMVESESTLLNLGVNERNDNWPV